MALGSDIEPITEDSENDVLNSQTWSQKACEAEDSIEREHILVKCQKIGPSLKQGELFIRAKDKKDEQRA